MASLTRKQLNTRTPRLKVESCSNLWKRYKDDLLRLVSLYSKQGVKVPVFFFFLQSSSFAGTVMHRGGEMGSTPTSPSQMTSDGSSGDDEGDGLKTPSPPVFFNGEFKVHLPKLKENLEVTKALLRPPAALIGSSPEGPKIRIDLEEKAGGLPSNHLHLQSLLQPEQHKVSSGSATLLNPSPTGPMRLAKSPSPSSLLTTAMGPPLTEDTETKDQTKVSPS